MSTVLTLPNNRWRDDLQTSPDGVVRKNLFNGVIITGQHPEMKNGLAYDEFQQAIVTKRPMPWGTKEDRPFTEIDLLNFVDWVQGERLPMSKEIAEQAIQVVAHRLKFHPMQDWMHSLEWDGVERIDHWLHDMLGVEMEGIDPDDEGLDQYVRQVGSKWLISAVARVMQPGCKADHMLVLEGDQGAGKSTAVRYLAGEQFFSDSLSDIKDKDSMMELQGVWIIELAELDHLKRTESTAMKAWMTKVKDRFRPPFGKTVQDFPRQCVFVGTVNGSSYLKDDTGNRRYWPVKVGDIDLQAIKENREQLWAEAFFRYQSGENWYLDADDVIGLAKRQQLERIESDPWEAELERWLVEQTKPFLINEALRQIDPNKERWSKFHEQRVAKCLVALGCRKDRKRVDKSRGWWWSNESIRGMAGFY